MTVEAYWPRFLATTMEALPDAPSGRQGPVPGTQPSWVFEGQAVGHLTQAALKFVASRPCRRVLEAGEAFWWGKRQKGVLQKNDLRGALGYDDHCRPEASRPQARACGLEHKGEDEKHTTTSCFRVSSAIRWS